jgi:hypothetical protein
MDVIQLLILLIIIGVLLWFVNSYVPMAAPIKTLINIVVVIVLLLWILRLFGFGSYEIGVPRAR